MQVDPAREFWNSYSYVANNPIMALDPSGKGIFLFFWDASEHYEGDSGVGHVAIGVGSKSSMVMFESNPIKPGIRELMDPNLVYLGSLDSVLSQSSPDHHNRPHPDLILEISNTTPAQDAAAIWALNNFFGKNTHWDLTAETICSGATTVGVEAAGFPLRPNPGLFSSPREMVFKLQNYMQVQHKKGITAEHPLMRINTLHGDPDRFMKNDGSVIGTLKVNVPKLFRDLVMRWKLTKIPPSLN